MLAPAYVGSWFDYFGNVKTLIIIEAEVEAEDIKNNDTVNLG